MKRLCQYCGKEINKKGGVPTCHECSHEYYLLINKNRMEIKCKKPKHTSTELEVIKNKYAGGVPVGEIEKWINGEKI